MALYGCLDCVVPARDGGKLDLVQETVSPAGLLLRSFNIVTVQKPHYIPCVPKSMYYGKLSSLSATQSSQRP